MKKTTYLLRDELNQFSDSLQKSETYYVLGTDSIYVPSLNTRFVDKTVCREWPDRDGVMVEMTPGEAARTELKRYYPDANMRARKSDFKLLDITPPMLFSGHQYHGHLWYIDLAGAYASIYRNLTLDCCWPRGSGTMPLRVVADRLWHWKVARNSVVGVTRAHTMTGVKGKYAKEVKFHNPFFNPALWRTIQAVLHGLAALAVRNSAIYVNTDCYIMTNARGYARVVEFLQGLDFNLHLGDGDGSIRGWSSYSIDGVKGTTRQQITDTKINNLVDDRETLQWYQKMVSYNLKQ